MLLNIGYSNYVNMKRLVCILNPDSAPVKRLIKIAKEDNTIIDATYGRKTRSVLITDNNSVILSSLQSDTLNQRLEEL